MTARRAPANPSLGGSETVTMTAETKPAYLPLADAASALGVASSTLRHQIRNRKIRAVKRGRDWYVRSDEVERYRTESQVRRTSSKSDVLDAAIAGCVEVIVAEIDRRVAEFEAERSRTTGDRAVDRSNAQGRAFSAAKADCLRALRAWIVDEVER